MKKIVLILTVMTSIHWVYAKVSYQRSLYGGWTDADKNCRNTRAEILVARSKTKVVFKNKRQCIVKSGLWDDFYYKAELTEAKDIDIDHVVPLKNAHDSGAASWSLEEKIKFANDPENLVITHKSHNRRKKDKSPLNWSPVSREYSCRYLLKWIEVKTRYKLTIDPLVYKYKEQVCEK